MLCLADWAPAAPTLGRDVAAEKCVHVCVVCRVYVCGCMYMSTSTLRFAHVCRPCGGVGEQPRPIRETGLSIRRRGAASASDSKDGADPSPGDADADADADADGGSGGGPCDSCGCRSSPMWDDTAVQGMTLCASCKVVLGGA